MTPRQSRVPEPRRQTASPAGSPFGLCQAFIFLLPHLLILLVVPEMWPILLFVFAGALVFGWIRIKSGSILGSWLMHASGNVTMGAKGSYDYRADHWCEKGHILLCLTGPA